MITRDFILRQVQQMVAALSRVMLRREAMEYHMAQDILSQTIQEVTGSDVEKVRNMTAEDLLDLCSVNEVFYSDKAVALADLLREDGFLQDAAGQLDAATLSWTRSVWLYEAASSAGGTVPLDLPSRLAELRALLQSSE